MKRRMLHSYFPQLLLILTLGILSCSPPGVVSEDGFTLMSYNAQTFFDDITQGTEFSEFGEAAKNWDSKAYLTRLSRLSRVIHAAWDEGPDIIVLNEIEGGSILKDLHELYLNNLNYTAYLCTEDSWSCLQTGAITRLPVEYFASLGVAARGARYRSILEVGLKTPKGLLVLFACHWKSKSGGAEETEVGRLAASRALSLRLEELHQEDPELPIVVAGDLNEVFNESLYAGYATALGLISVGGGLDDPNAPDRFPGLILVADPEDPLQWQRAGARGLYSSWAHIPGGSYHYQGNWEGIDHILVNRPAWQPPGVSVLKFEVITQDFLLTADGSPRRFIQSFGNGFSDHLPVLMRFSNN